MATGRSVNELLAPQVILREVSRIQLPGTVLSDIFGWGLAARNPDAMSGNMIDYQIREGKYDVYNRSRLIAHGSKPGTSNTNIAPQKVGKVDFVIPRSAEQMPLTHEDLVNRRQIGQAVTVIDSPQGENYIMRQKRYMAERYANMIEFQTASMLRGSYTFDQQGDELRQGFSGGSTTVDFQLAANNKNQLNGIIATSWAIPSTDIPGQIMSINLQCNTNSGLGIEHAVMNSATLQYMQNCDKIKAQAGTSNTPFETYNRIGPGMFSLTFRAIPWLKISVVDYSLDIWDGSANTTTTLIGTDQVNFFPEPSPDWVQYINGGEVVTEGPKGAVGFRQGFYAYGYEAWNPSGWNLCAVHNGFPAMYIPDAMFFADVTP